MAIFTTTDRDNVKAALIQLAVDGVVTVSVGGQSVTTRSVDELNRLLQIIQQDLASANARCGMRMIKTIPPGCG